jgi:hypothetical protein
MRIDFFTFPNNSYKFYEVDILNSFKCEYIQKVDYIGVSSGKTRAYNYGTPSDRWVADITIQGLNSQFEEISRSLVSDVGDFFATLGDGEQIFGSGIDYSLPINCNIINSSRQYSQNNIALSTIKLKLEAVVYSSELSFQRTQLKYKDSIPAGLPAKLNFQTPIDRQLIKRESPFQSENFGNYGMITEEVNSQSFSLVFDQNEAEMAQIEKFVSVQRSTPFIFSEADYLYLFEDQDTEEVMITGFIITRVNHNHWRTTLKLVNNV